MKIITRTSSNTSNTSSNYFPDDLPHPSSMKPTTVEVHYLQCGCTIQQETAHQDPYASYGDVVSWSPSHGNNSPPRAASPTPSANESEVTKVVDPNFCERSCCGRSLVFNREWNRLWEAHNTEMKAALDDNVTFEQFKARIRKEAKEATDGLLGTMTKNGASN